MLVKQILLFSLIVTLLGSLQAKAQLSSHFLLQNESFLSPQYEATEKSQYQFLGLKLQNSLDAERLILDSEAVMAVGAPLLNYIKIKEVAAVIPNSDRQHLYVGRKKILWSEMDESWSLGAIEPVFKWNPLNRESHGLSGLFWVSEQPTFQFTAFLSPIYLPDQGPQYEINSQGQFKKMNPWFQNPPKTFRPFPGSDASSEIKYTIHQPSETDVIFQTSVGGSLEGTVGESFLWRTSYFNKPMNQLILGYDGVYSTATDTGNVDILPLVGHHQVASLDLVWSQGPFRWGVSYLNDQPEQVDFAPEWTAPKLEDANLYSGFVQIQTARQKWRFEYLTIEGGRVQEQGEFADANRAPITLRFPFFEAYRGSYQVFFPLKKREKITLDFSWTHSDRNQFDLIQVKGSFRIQKRWEVYADMQTVKAESVKAKNANDIGGHANNDRLMVGAAYEL